MSMAGGWLVFCVASLPCQCVEDEAKLDNRPIAELMNALGATNVKVRIDAVNALGRLRAEAMPAAESLVQLLRLDAAVEVRERAAYALGDIGGKVAVQALIEMARSGTVTRVRCAAIWGLAELGEQAAGAGPILVAGMEEHGAVGGAACDALLAIGASTVPSLIKAIENPHYNAHGSVAWILGGLGAQAQSAIPALARCLRDDPYEEDRCAAASAIGQIGSDPSLHSKIVVVTGMPALVAACRDKSPYVRIAAAVEMPRVDVRAESPLQVIIPVLTDPNPHARALAAYTLGRVGSHSQKAAAALTVALHDKYQGARCNAATALSEFGELAKPAIPQLRAALNDRDESVRNAARRALKRIIEDR